jgi:hypothetical protein
MHLADLILTCGPPALAIALQACSIPSNRALERGALDAQSKAGLPPAATKLIEFNLKGAVAVASLPTTFVSFGTGAFALVYTERGAVIYLFVLFCMAVLLGVFVWHVVSGRSYFDIVELRLRSMWPVFGSRFLPLTAGHVIAGAIYTTNGLLIALSLAFYFRLL